MCIWCLVTVLLIFTGLVGGLLLALLSSLGFLVFVTGSTSHLPVSPGRLSSSFFSLFFYTRSYEFVCFCIISLFPLMLVVCALIHVFIVLLCRAHQTSFLSASFYQWGMGVSAQGFHSGSPYVWGWVNCFSVCVCVCVCVRVSFINVPGDRLCTWFAVTAAICWLHRALETRCRCSFEMRLATTVPVMSWNGSASEVCYI